MTTTGFKNKARAIRRLRAIPPAVRKAARVQLRVNAAQLVETQKGFAPVDDGTLRASIKHEDVSDATRISQRVSAGSGGAFYARWVEFGHGNAEPRPFFFPAWRMLRRRFRTRMSRAAKKAIQQGARTS